jgi:hypothetical protein
MEMIHVLDSKGKAFEIEVEENVSGVGPCIIGISLASQKNQTATPQRIPLVPSEHRSLSAD